MHLLLLKKIWGKKLSEIFYFMLYKEITKQKDKHNDKCILSNETMEFSLYTLPH